jgi:hypothetical protein
MLSIKEAKATLQQIGMSEEETSQFEVVIQPFIEYHRYLMEKENITSEDAEKLTQESTKAYMNENATGSENQIELFELVGKGYKEFALKSGYDKDECEALESNLVELVNFFVKITSTIENGK